MEVGVDLHGILFDHTASCLIVSGALDPLDLCKKFTEEIAQRFIVIDLHVCFSAFFHQLHNLVGRTVLQSPCSYQLTVTHVGFLKVLAKLHAGELSHQSVEHILVVFGLVCFRIIKQSELQHLGISKIIERKEVGTGFFKSGAMGFQGVGIDSGHKPSGSVAETLVQIGVKIVCHKTIFLHQVACGLVDDEFFGISVALRRLIVRFGDILQSHGFGAVSRAYPVGIGKIDAYGCGGICVAGQNGGCDHLGGHTLHFGLTIFRIDRRIVLKPLGIAGHLLRAVGSIEILEIDY